MANLQFSIFNLQKLLGLSLRISKGLRALHRLPVIPWVSVVLVVLIFSVLSSRLFVAPAGAADGIRETINFQGKLVDENGLNVPDDDYTVVFTLYNDPTAGSNLWDETQTVSTVDGIFQVELGTVDTSLGDVNFNSDLLYLGIKVGADTEMTPRIRFTAVPYAFNAQKVNGLNVTNTSGNPFNSATTLRIAEGKTVTVSNGLTLAGTDGTTITFQGTDTYVGLATTDILTNKTIGSTGLTFAGAGTDITTASNENFVFDINGSGDLVMNADFDSGVSIGSASNTPAPLSVSGGIGNNAALIVNQTNSGDLFVASSAGITRFRVANNGDVVLSAGLNVSGSVGNGAQCLLGGATASWGSCSGVASTNYWELQNGLLYNGNTTTDFAIGGTTSESAKLKVSMSGTQPTASVSGLTSSAAFVVDNRGVGDLFTASSSGLNRFVITQNGNVGIGTTTPGNKLQVIGGNIDAYDGGTQGTLLTNSGSIELAQTVNGAFIDFKTTVGEDYDARIEAYGGGLALRTGGSATQRHLFDANGLIGFNTVNPLATLDVRGASGTLPVASVSGQTSFAGLVIDNAGSGDIFTASSSGLTRLTLKQDGALVLGTAANGLTFDHINGGPTYTGTARITKKITLSAEYPQSTLTASGSATITGQMTSDASPSATFAAGTRNWMNYFMWTSTQTALHDYTVALRFTLPKDFSAWVSGTAIQVYYNTHLPTEDTNKLDVVIYNDQDTTATPVFYSQANKSTSAKTWTSLDITSTQLTSGTQTWNSADSTAVIYFKMYAKDSNYVQLGDVVLNYLSKF